MEDVKIMIAAVDFAAKESKTPSMTSLVELFRALRKSKVASCMQSCMIHRPDIVTKYGHQVIISGAVRGVEVWSLYEQAYVAALECGDIGLVDECSKLLNKKFPDSVRVKRLLGMQYEYNGEYKKALALYDSLLESNSSNLLLLKRKVSVYKAQGDLKSAALEIHKILGLIYADPSLWLELADIHMSLGDYKAAAYCLEDVILQNPQNSAFNTRLADVYYTIGGFENIAKARRHYTMSLNLQCPRLNRRALYGLISSAKALEGLSNEQSKGLKTFSDHESAVNKEILSWGRDQLKAISSPDGSHSTASGTGEGGVKGEGALKLHKAILDVL